jgi:hypothetical protein
MTKITPDLPEDLEDKLLAGWVKGLPDPPPALVNATLDKLRNATTVSPVVRPALRWKRLVLAGMVAVVGLVGASLVIFTLLNGFNLQKSANPTTVSQVLTVTPGESPPAVPPPTAVQTAAQAVSATTAAPRPTFTPAPVSQNSPQGQADTVTPAASQTLAATSPAEATTQAGSRPVAPTPQPDLPTVPPAIPTFTLKPEPTRPLPTATATPPAPTAASPAPATPIVGVYTIPASASPAANRTFSGQISTLTATSLTLSNLTNVFILNSATKVRVNGQASPVSALKVGDNVVIQAAFNAQSELIAQDISTSVTRLPKPITPPGSGE